MEITKERKRLGRSPFFSHEQERRHRSKQRDGERRRERSFPDARCKTITQGPVADLIVVLEKVDEGERRQSARWLTTNSTVSMSRGLALIGEARAERTRDVPARIWGVILIIAPLLARQQAMPSMVIVVVPLGTVFSVRNIGQRIEQTCAVVVVLQDQMDQSSRCRRELSDRVAELMKERELLRFEQGMHRVEAKTVEAIMFKPMQCIADGEGADLWNAIVDGVSPRRMSGGEECRRVAVKVVTFRAEMVVDDVEKHHEPPRMRFVDQHSQIVGPTIGAVWRIEQDAVVSPVSAACEIGNRHQLDCSHAGLDDMIELVDCRAERARWRERADVQFQDGRLVPAPPAPILCPPFESGVIDDLARPEHILGLEV